jgi:hypothetical protein
MSWGDLDYLSPIALRHGDEPWPRPDPGTDAHAVIVTTQGVAVDDVRRSVTFCRQMGNPILGIVENMSGFVCPTCKTTHDIFNSGGGEALAKEMGVRFLGRIPMDPEVVRSGDEGYAFMSAGGHPHGQGCSEDRGAHPTWAKRRRVLAGGSPTFDRRLLRIWNSPFGFTA